MSYFKANSKAGLLYHVQYFGDAPERGYIFEKNMVSFTGEDQYQDLSQGNRQLAARAIHKKVNLQPLTCYPSKYGSCLFAVSLLYWSVILYYRLDFKVYIESIF